jgi:Leucine-rich repeat (LRR) protein
LNESDEADVDGLKDNGIRIVEKCDGLPLAVKVLGGLLLNTSRTRDAWVDVSNHVTWSMEGMDDDINKAVYLSYEELPSHLKQCFLFCSLFPKDELLSFGVISQLWIAEGYTDNKLSSKLPEDLALEYYKELISRNLLEPDKRSYDQLGCTMHDVVRSFAQYITKDEAVLITEGQDVRRTIGGTSKLRHLSISRRPVEWDALKSQTSLRTLMLFRSTTTVEPKDLMNNISGLRVLYLDNENPVELPDSICRLKHLRYLCLSRTSISMIPQGIGDLKFLQALELRGCTNFSQLPNSILKLRKLRSLNFSDTAITSVPRGFGKLEDLVRLMGFPTHSGDSTDVWCSLEELGPLSKLKVLGIRDLEKATSGSTAAKAMLTSKHHLTNLYLIFTSKLGKNGEVEDDIGEEEHERTEEVLANLCPPTCTEILDIRGYFARGLPQWMRTMSAFGSLRRLALGDYACCTQLPNGLGQLPFLDYFWVDRAPSVQCVRHDFLHPSLGGEADGKDKGPRLPGTRNNNPRQPHRISRGAGVAFPKLTRLGFQGMLEWTEWEWEQHVPAMPALEALVINNCKLQRLPAGLAQHASRLRKFDLTYAQHLISVENFPSLVNLWLYGNPRLERISNNPSLQFIDISNCPALKEMDGLPSLRSLEWWDLGAEALPQYLREANLKKLRVDCSRSLLKLIALQDESSEWGKIKHVQQLKAYGHKTEEEEPDQSSQEDEEANEEEANQLEEDEVEEDTIQSEEEEDADEEKNNQSEEDEEAEWYIYYTKEPYSFNAYLGESTGDFIIFDLLGGFIVVNLCKSHKMDSFAKLYELVCLDFAQE